MKLNDLMVLCTNLQKHVLDLEKAKSDQAIKIANLKKRVEKHEKRRQFRTTNLKRLKKVGTTKRVESSNDSLGAQEDTSKQGRRIEDIDADDKVTLVNETQERQDEDLMFDTRVLDDDEVFMDVTTVEKEEQSTKTGEAITTAGLEDSAAPIIPTTVEETLAQTLMEIKAAKPKAKGIVFYDLEKQVSKPTVSVTQPSVKDKGKGIMQKPERPLTKKDQVALDEDLVRNIQAQLEAEIIEEERLARMKEEEANGIEESTKETEDEQRSDKSKKVEGNAEKATATGSRKKSLGKKRAVKEQQQESPKRQKLEEDKETGEHEEVEADDTDELKKHMVIKKDDDIAIDVIPLSTKPPVIVDYKLHKEGLMAHYQLIRADRISKRYSSMIRLLQGINREDLHSLEVSQNKAW
ncbi:hypothetical protein Tco_1134035 [Tanacetum coccineum]